MAKTKADAKADNKAATQAARVGETLEKLVGMFGAGGAALELPAAVARTTIRRQGSPGDRPSDLWSLSNRLIMLFSGTEDARGFKQWKGAGRSVRKGSKALWILAPVQRTFFEDDEKRGERVPRRVLVGFKAVPVFAVEDTEGEPLPDSEATDHAPVGLPPLFETAGDLGVSVEYAPGGAGTRGEYGSYHLGGSVGKPGELIRLRSHDEGVFFHELAHAAHDRITPGGLKGGQDPRQEIVAETAAAALCLIYGFEGYVPNARDYVAGYARKAAPAGDPGRTAAKAVLGVLSDVEKVLAYILEPARRPALEAPGTGKDRAKAPAAA